MGSERRALRGVYTSIKLLAGELYIIIIIFQVVFVLSFFQVVVHLARAALGGLPVIRGVKRQGLSQTESAMTSGAGFGRLPKRPRAEMDITYTDEDDDYYYDYSFVVYSYYYFMFNYYQYYHPETTRHK